MEGHASIWWAGGGSSGQARLGQQGTARDDGRASSTSRARVGDGACRCYHVRKGGKARLRDGTVRLWEGSKARSRGRLSATAGATRRGRRGGCAHPRGGDNMHL